MEGRVDTLDRGNGHTRRRAERLELPEVEVRDAEVADLALVDEALEGAPDPNVRLVRSGLVKEIEIDPSAQAREASTRDLLDARKILRVDLRHQEDRLAATLLELRGRVADLLLVAIAGRGVCHPVPDFEALA